jgi:hypothetical protein
MRRTTTILRRLIFTAAIVIAGSALGTMWLARSEWLQQWATRQIAAALGPSVRFADARLAPWPPPLTLALNGVEVLDAAGTPIVRAHRVVAHIRLRGLLGRPPLLAQIAVDGVALELGRDHDGAVRLGAGMTGGGGARVPTDLDAQCPRITLRDGRMTLHASGRELQIEDITATLTPTRPGARLTMSGRSAELGALRGDATVDRLTALETAPFRAEFEARDADAAAVAPWLPAAGAALRMAGHGRLAVSAQGQPNACTADIALELHDGGVGWRDAIRATAPIAVRLRGGWGSAGLTAGDGQIDAARVEVAGLEATGLRAAFAADASGVTLRDAQWRSLGGTWRQSGTVRLADVVTFDGGIDAQAVDGAAAAAALRQLVGDAVSPLQLAGPLALHAAAAGTVGAPLSGQLAASMETGTAGWDTTTATAPWRIRAEATLDGTALTLRDAQAQAAAVSDRDLTASDVAVRFAFDGTAVQIASATARAFDGDWTVAGTVPLRGAPTLSLQAVGINAAHLARAALTGRREDTGTAGDVDVTATLRGGAGEVDLRLASPTLTYGPLLIAQPAAATGTLSWSGTAVRVRNGSAQLARVRIAGHDVGNVRAAFASAGNGRLRVAPLTARAFGGDWQVSAALGRDEIDGTVRGRGVNLDDVLAALAAGPRSERASASVDATVTRRRDGTVAATLAVQLSRGRFLFGDLAVTAPARGTGDLRVDGARWTVENGVASASAARYDVFAGTHASARLSFGPDHVQFADLRCTAAGALWQGSGRIDLEAPSIDGALSVTRADPDAVLAMLGIKAPGLDPDGLDVTLRARSPLDARWREALQGNGRMALRGGYLTSTGLLRAIVAAIVPTRALREGGPPNRLTSLTQSFTLGGGRLQTEDLTVDSDDYDLTATGSIGLDGSLDLMSRISLTPNGIKKIFALSAVPIPGSNLWTLPVIPARVGGSLEQPAIHPEATALAGTTARWFVDALIGAPRTIGQTIVQPLDWMFTGVRDLVAPPTPAVPR